MTVHQPKTFYTEYHSELIGKLCLFATDRGLTTCIFEHDRYLRQEMIAEAERADCLPIFKEASAWLDSYFAGENPAFPTFPLDIQGTPFQQAVWELLRVIPYGQTTTYGAIAKQLALSAGHAMSNRAVGVAVGKNPLCIMVPCHRVVGAQGNLTGFGGGLGIKVKLLAHEGCDMSLYKIPTKGTAL